MSTPSKIILPPVFFSIPAIILARVDLPPPLGPVITMNLSSLIIWEISRIISTFLPSLSAVKDMFFSSSIFIAPFYFKSGVISLILDDNNVIVLSINVCSTTKLCGKIYNIDDLSCDLLRLSGVITALHRLLRIH